MGSEMCIRDRYWRAEQTIYGDARWANRPLWSPGLQSRRDSGELVEQEAGHFLAAQLASAGLGGFLGFRHGRGDVQITDGTAVAGGRSEPGELETDAVVGSAMESSSQTV